MNNKHLVIGLLGYGIVGKGIYDIIQDNQDKYDIHVKKVLSLDTSLPLKEGIYAENADDLLLDPEINLVIECLGGDSFAYPCIKTALENGKSVISSNKETFARHFDEYHELAEKNDVYLLYEASVGGGIPLIRTMKHILSYDEIHSFIGILNGTTNFIITKMSDEGYSFDDALKLAQKLGFAEKDPSADLLGLDMVRKGIILSNLCYGVSIGIDDVPHFGIENLTMDIIQDIKSMNKVLKMVVSSSYQDGKLCYSILPSILPLSHPLASAKYENNAISLYCRYNDVVTLQGKGAGRYPTGAAIMQDVMAIYNNEAKFVRGPVKKVQNTLRLEGTYYIVKKHMTIRALDPDDEVLKDALFVAKIV